MSLYNLHRTDIGWKINKFDDDLNVEASYDLVEDYIEGEGGETRCNCPAGQRPTCRHRQMFPLLHTRVDSPWFLDFDTRQWVDPTGEAASEASSSNLEMDLALAADGEKLRQLTGDDHGPMTIEQAVDAITPRDDHPFRRRM